VTQILIFVLSIPIIAILAFAFASHLRASELEVENADLRRQLAERPPAEIYLYDWREYERNARNN
jgi:hypothetical protein